MIKSILITDRLIYLLRETERERDSKEREKETTVGMQAGKEGKRHRQKDSKKRKRERGMCRKNG